MWVGLAVAGCAAASGPPAALAQGEVAFERHEVVTGRAERQTILTGDVLGDPMAEVLALHVDRDGQRRLTVYALDDGAWTSKLGATLAPGVWFVDVARIDGRDRLITYRRGRVSWFDPDTATERDLVAVATRYNPTRLGRSYAGTDLLGPANEPEIPHVDITRDLNSDGRDDVIVPDVDGFWVAVQTGGGAFAEPVRLGPAEPFRDRTGFSEKRKYGQVGISPLTIPWYLSRVHQMDYDGDGRGDLVFWNEDHFDVHRQDEHGLFLPEPETLAVDAPFASDGTYSVLFGFGDKSAFSLVLGLGKRIEQTLLRSVRDMNGDGVADLVTHSLRGRSLLRQRSRYAVHPGRRTAYGIVFAPEASTVIQPRGRAGAGELSGYSSLWLEDFDGDGEVDVMRTDVEIGVGAMVRALVGSSVSVGTELYRMEEGAYPDKATATHKIKVDVKLRGGDGGFFPPVLVGDVNGDGRADMVMGKSKQELHLFLGVAGPELLAQKPQSVAVTLPANERNSWLVDLNRDGKQDVLIHRPSTTEAHRVSLLIAR